MYMYVYMNFNFILKIELSFFSLPGTQTVTLENNKSHSEANWTSKVKKQTFYFTYFHSFIFHTCVFLS